MPTVKELREELEKENTGLKKFFDDHTKDGEIHMDGDDIAKVREWNDSITELGKKFDAQRATDEIAGAVAKRHEELNQVLRPPFGAGAFDPGQKGAGKDQPEMKSIGQRVIESPDFRETGEKMRVSLPDFDMKTLMTTAAGFAPFVTRQPGIVEYPMRRPMVQDIMPQTTLNESAVKFMEETTATNSAASVSEGANNKPESALVYTERSVPMETIANWIPVTRQQLRYAPQVRSLIDNRLSLFVLLAEETEILTGSGSTPHLTGFLNKSGVQTQAKGSDPVPDAIFKAMTLVRNTGFAEPGPVIFHPNDWQDVRLLRTADGLYIWGSPAEAGPERIWGKEVIQTTAMTENTALTGDFALYSELFRAGGIEIYFTDSHASLFIQNTFVILAEILSTLAIYRGSAFCKITGI